MNIQKLETVLDEMRLATFEDPAAAEQLVRKWAEQIGDAISGHLIAELADATSSTGAPPDMCAESGGYDWDGKA